jgi:hypothetical protein
MGKFGALFDNRGSVECKFTQEKISRLFVADTQFFSALGSAASQDDASVFRRHSGAESMFIDALPTAGLKCGLHVRVSLLNRY